MRFVKFGGVPMHDCPSAILLNGKRITIADGVGVNISSGLITVLDLFQLQGEDFHRYRMHVVYPWDKDTLEFEYPPIDDVPVEAWELCQERVEPKSEVEKAKEDMPYHWSFREKQDA